VVPAGQVKMLCACDGSKKVLVEVAERVRSDGEILRPVVPLTGEIDLHGTS